MLPSKTVFASRVAEPTCQKMLEALAPLVRTTLLPSVIRRVDAIFWKMKTAFSSPPASSVAAGDEDVGGRLVEA
jgi:hypothetical protein